MPHARHIGLVLAAILVAPMACGDHEPDFPHSRKKANFSIAGSHSAIGATVAGGGNSAADFTGGYPDRLPDAGVPAAAGAQSIGGAGVNTNVAGTEAGVPSTASPTPKVVGVETLASRLVRAGDAVAVTCLTVDENGRNSVVGSDVMPSLRVTPNGSAIPGDVGTLTAVLAGELAIACTIPALQLEDGSPALVNVLPGNAVRTLAHVEPAVVTAGAGFVASCTAEDALLNPISNMAPIFSVSPSDAKNQLQSGVGRFERAGRYTVECPLFGAIPTAATLDVIPGPAASLQIARSPDRIAYSVGESITLNHVVTDAFGNRVPSANVSVLSSPAASPAPEGKFSYSKPGQYRVTATVTSETLQDVILTKSVDILVDDGGPTAICDSPAHADTLKRSPGGHLTLRGTVTDVTGIKELRVNGSLTSLDNAGHFSVDLTTRYGVNFVDLVALDNGDRKSTRSCAFLLADHFTADGALLKDSVSLRLSSTAIDDDARNDLDSVADIFDVILASNGLRDSIHKELLADPILKSGCDQSQQGTCLLSSRITYLDTKLDGPNQAHLSLVPGGIASVSRIENLAIKLQVDASLAGLDYSNLGWIAFDSVEVATIFDVDASSGTPRAHLRAGSTTTTLGHIGTNFPGVEGAVLDLIVQVANDVIAEVVASSVQSYVTKYLDGVLDGIISGLGIDSGSQSLVVTRLDGGEPIALTFGSEFSSVGIDSNRILYGMGTRFGGPIAHARPTLGAPAASAITPMDVNGNEPVGVALYEGIFSQGLHALWHAGYFDASFDASNQALGLLPGMQVSIATQLPPVTEIIDDRIRLSLGAVTALLSYPAALTTPVPMTLGARASLKATLVNQSLVFDDFTLDELHLSIDDPSTDALTRALLESVVPEIMKLVVTSALREALPVLPIPSLALPSSLTTYGLSPTSALELASPNLALQSPFLVLRGNAKVTD